MGLIRSLNLLIHNTQRWINFIFKNEILSLRVKIFHSWKYSYEWVYWVWESKYLEKWQQFCSIISPLKGTVKTWDRRLDELVKIHHVILKSHVLRILCALILMPSILILETMSHLSKILDFRLEGVGPALTFVSLH